MIIGITGYGYSGASAYIDVLKEFDNIQSFPGDFEFQIVQEPDGLLELMNGLVYSRRRIYSNTVINRFLKCAYGNSNRSLSGKLNGKYERINDNYIKRLVSLTWNGRSSYDPDDIRSFYEKKIFSQINRIIIGILNRLPFHIAWPPASKRYFSFISKEDFIDITREYIKELLKSAGFDLNGTIILEQVFSTSDPLSGVDFFDDEVISLIVDRDPRDVYILTNVLYPEKCGFMPNNGDVDKFITYYKLLHYNTVKDSRVHYLQFEDLIYHYSETVKKLETIINKKNIAPLTVFMPQKSINNTQMYKKYPEHRNEIIKIEEQLSDYLYDFEKANKYVDFERKIVKPF